MISVSPSRPAFPKQAEGKGFEPSSARGRNRLSRAARPTVSGYLPFFASRYLFCRQTAEWTAGESNPDFLVASQASSRLTSSPGWRVESPRSKVQSRKDKENASAAVFRFWTLDFRRQAN